MGIWRTAGEAILRRVMGQPAPSPCATCLPNKRLRVLFGGVDEDGRDVAGTLTADMAATRKAAEEARDIGKANRAELAFMRQRLDALEYRQGRIARKVGVPINGDLPKWLDSTGHCVVREKQEAE